MTQSEIRAKLELLASFARAAAKLEAEINDDIKTEKGQKFASVVIRNVRDGANEDIDETMRLLKELGHLSHLTEGEPVATPFINFTSAYFMDMGARYPEGDKLFTRLGVSDHGTCQATIDYGVARDNDYTPEFSFACAEIKKGELSQVYGLPEDNKDIDVYLWEDICNDDYTRKFSISHKEVEEFLEREEKEE